MCSLYFPKVSSSDKMTLLLLNFKSVPWSEDLLNAFSPLNVLECALWHPVWSALVDTVNMGQVYMISRVYLNLISISWNILSLPFISICDNIFLTISTCHSYLSACAEFLTSPCVSRHFLEFPAILSVTCVFEYLLFSSKAFLTVYLYFFIMLLMLKLTLPGTDGATTTFFGCF